MLYILILWLAFGYVDMVFPWWFWVLAFIGCLFHCRRLLFSYTIRIRWA